ncbi:MAG: branched-chain amino acid ABC transporter substrate-binding protein [Gammaproteobacteria bacterium]|nr:branched-chain amino acid ABC transporter substrate-binding protein [Gammaproteobacteria bacterium]
MGRNYAALGCQHLLISRVAALSVVLRAAVTALVLLPAQPGYAAEGDDIPADPVHLAIAAPMVGTSFTVGVQLSAGVAAALLSLPDGKLLGRDIRVTTHNDSCVSDIAERVALDLMQSPPDLVIGHSCSATTIATAPIYAQHKVLQITPSTTNPQATEMGISTLFRMIGRDDVQVDMAVERIATKYAGQRIGILHFQTEYSRWVTRGVIEGLRKRGIEPDVIVESGASAISYIGEIQKLMAAENEVIYLAGGALDSGVFMRQARQIGARFQVISSDTLISHVFPETAGTAAEGVHFTFPSQAAELATAATAVAAIQQMGQQPVGYTLLTYAAVQTWIEGVRRAASFDAELVAAAIRSAPLETILGSVTFDAKGDIQTSYPAFSWYTWEAGERVAID